MNWNRRDNIDAAAATGLAGLAFPALCGGLLLDESLTARLFFLALGES